jgi:hypothetical protein
MEYSECLPTHLNPWLRGPVSPRFFTGQASESLVHATKAGEILTGLGGHPSVTISDVGMKTDLLHFCSSACIV